MDNTSPRESSLEENDNEIDLATWLGLVEKIFLRVRQRLQQKITTLTPALYNHHRDGEMPSAEMIVKKSGLSWNQVLSLLSLSPALAKNTLARLSNTLQLLEKRILRKLRLGWDEKSVLVSKSSKKMRPDSLCMEEIYLHNQRILALDVKLSLTSAPITIYKYLPIFEQGLREQTALTHQQTFFPEWLPKNAVNVELVQHVYDDGQLGLYFENNILYICYLIGWQTKNLMPGAEVLSLQNPEGSKKNGRKKLPSDMEVRFIPFAKLPKLYCEIAGITYTPEIQKEMQALLDIADVIKKIVLTTPPEAALLSEEIYNIVKNPEDLSDQAMLARVCQLISSEEQESWSF